ncbi:MAG: gamma-glutamyl-gamma-aminobutyrate hydrolase family protein [Bacillota bacterium]
MRPLVGISCGFDEDGCRYYLRPGYWESVESAGGTPVILPPADSPEVMDHYLKICDGYILSGGEDIDPVFWGADPEPGLGEIDPRRDRFEICLVREIISRDKPALFVCRGIQVLNVALGGTLFQDLQSDISHRQRAPRYHPFHDILLEKDSVIYRLFQRETVKVNSFHHQAIDNLAPGLVVTARARDGVVEAVEHPAKRWILGVQWHPEAMRDELSARLFRALVEAAAQ